MTKIIIIGGGPTGLGAAYKLKESGQEDFLLFEKNMSLGGLSGSVRDDKGFYWDYGGHVSFSHYDYYDKFVDDTLGHRVYHHLRESWICFHDSWVPYPFQNNIRYLNNESQLECVDGLLQKEVKKGDDFRTWILNTFGKGISEKFMLPYNFKVWATPPELMSTSWMKERVSLVDVRRVIKNIILKQDDLGWGPNSKFLFPKKGGTGAIFEGGGRKIGKNIVRNQEIVKIDNEMKVVYLTNGEKHDYDFLISTIPITKLVNMLKKKSVTIDRAAENLVHNSVYVIGLGIQKKINTSKCWVYFPEMDDPFYRLTFFHNYSRYNVPNGDTEKYSSLMCEVSFSKYKKVDKSKLIEACIDALIKKGILEKGDRGKIVSKQIYTLPYAYPIPTIERDSALKTIQNYLLKNKIYSRGRFGAWKYEIGNMDHSFMQGVEAVEKILDNKKEKIWS